jgi:signal transduction histidine kinase
MIKPQNHPIKFLLYFEWVMFGLVLLAELPRFSNVESPRLLPVLVSIGLFALLGLRLPESSRKLKLGYLIASFGTLFCCIWFGKVRLIALIYVVLIIRLCFVLRSRARIFTTILILAFALVQQLDRVQLIRSDGQSTGQAPPRRPNIRRPPPVMPPSFLPPPRFNNPTERAWSAAISAIILLGIICVFVQLMIDAVLSERRSRQALEAANDQLRRYASRVEDLATVQERNRIAREIHDSLGHSLTAFNLHVEAALRLLKSDPEEAKDLLIDAKKLGSQALREVRESVATLRSSPLQGKTFEAAIGQLCEDFTRLTGIVPTQDFAVTAPIGAEVEMAFYRIIQEALTNITKHAQATNVSLRFSQTATHINLLIQDDGQGFVMAQTTTGFGLQGMRERVEALGGSCEVSSAIGAGCRISIQVPVAPLPDDVSGRSA